MSGQAGPGSVPPMAEEVFTNVQVLRGIPVNEFMGTMGVFSAALGMSCGNCHTAGDADWSLYAEDNPRKQMARVMVLMMNTINRTNFGGRQVVTCYTCHRGSARPRTTANLDEFYGVPSMDPNAVFEQAPLAPLVEDVLDAYVDAVGGAERVSRLASFIARGTSVGYGPEGEPRPFEVFARPGQRTTIIHTSSGDNTTTFDGRAGWIAAPFRPVTVLALSDQDVDGLKLDADLSFPASIREALSEWRVGLAAVIDERDVYVVQGTTARGAIATLFFDMESGLLVRQIRYTDSPVGRLPTQVDYADYREVAGVRMPFQWTVTWLDGRDSFELTEVQPNVPIDDARFDRPPAP